VDDGIFFGGDDAQITECIKALKDQGLEVEDHKEIHKTMLVSTLRSFLMVKLSLPKELSLRLSSMT
jgi:hypothetical protein